MKIITQIADIRRTVQKERLSGKKVGLVPTMGYLHDGHLELMNRAKAECDLVIASIFVNPLQFGPGEDYDVYPRDLVRDAKLAASAGVDIVFAPTVEEMYPNGYDNVLTFVDLKEITGRLCGKQRPGHFCGVATVVSKLFHIVEPNFAYFGQKDAQQVAVLQRMVQDLNMNVAIRIVPIVREADGLAMSSRNVYLNAVERQTALVLFKALRLAEKMLRQGEKRATIIYENMYNLISAQPQAEIDYIAIVDACTLQDVDIIESPVLIALAVKIGKVRLIDNYVWEE